MTRIISCIFFILAPFICYPQFEYRSDSFADNISEDVLSKIADPTANLNLRYSDFLVTILDYDLLGDINFSNYEGEPFPFVVYNTTSNLHLADTNKFYFVPLTDTLFVEQDITNQDISERLIRITPLTPQSNVHYKISIALKESLTQLLPLEEYYDDDASEKSIGFETLQLYSPYKTIADSATYFFRVPDTETLPDIDNLKQELALQDTLVYYEGELSFTAEYIYKDKPAVFRIEGALLKIEKFKREDLIEEKYIHISFPEAC